MGYRLDKRDRAILQKAVDDRAIDIIKSIANAFVLNANKGTVRRDTAFLTAAEALTREVRRETLQRFLEELEHIAHDENYGQG